MNKIKYGDVLFAVLMAAALLALFLAFEYRQKFGVRAPAATVVLPGAPPGTAPEAAKSVSGSGAGINKKGNKLKPKVKKVKRVSRLQDPGEALIGGAGSETARRAPAVPVGSK